MTIIASGVRKAHARRVNAFSRDQLLGNIWPVSDTCRVVLNRNWREFWALS